MIKRYNDTSEIAIKKQEYNECLGNLLDLDKDDEEVANKLLDRLMQLTEEIKALK